MSKLHGVSYTQSMRSEAKDKSLGLFTIAYETAGGSYNVLQGPATEEEIKRVAAFMERFIGSRKR